MIEEPRHQEYYLTILGPDAFALTNWLSEHGGWVFSSVAQTSLFGGYAIGYSSGLPARSFEGIGINDGTVILKVEPVNE